MDYTAYFNNDLHNSYLYDVGSAATRQFIKQFIPPAFKKILEVGPGLNPITKNSTIVDLGNPNANFNGSIEKTSFNSASFDLIIMSHVLEHIKSDFAAIKECKRLLRPGGRLLIFTPGHKTGICDFKEMIKNGHIRRYNRERIALLESTDFPCTYYRNVHYVHNLIWNRLKFILKAINYPFKLTDKVELYDRKWYRKIQPWIIFKLDSWDERFTRKQNANVFCVFEKQ